MRSNSQEKNGNDFVQKEMTTVTSLPLAQLSAMGTLKSGGLQAHTIRQVSHVNGPDLVGSDGDLVIDTGLLTRGNNGKFKLRGGIEGESTKADVLETGVWDRTLDIGLLSKRHVTASTVEEHLTDGTLLTGLKVPMLNGSMDANKIYTLRNVGTEGHVAWDTMQDTDIDGDLSVSNDLHVGGKVTIEGNLEVLGTTTSISSTTLLVEDKTLEIAVVNTPTDTTADGAGLVVKGATDKTILYQRAAAGSAASTQLSAWALSEDIVLGKKTTPFDDTITSQLTASGRSQVLHFGDVTSSDGHWMLVADTDNQRLQFWYGNDIADDYTLTDMPTDRAKLAFEIAAPP